MFISFKTFVCVAALACCSLAERTIKITSPKAGTVLKAKSNITVEIDASPLDEYSTELGFAIGLVACPDGCQSVDSNLGHVLAQGATLGSSYRVTVPDWFNGNAQLGVIDAVLHGPYSVPQWETAAVAVGVTKAVGRRSESDAKFDKRRL